jgi:hypothetical protein
MGGLVDTAELAELGYTVVRNFLTPSECARARAAIDGAFGSTPTDAVNGDLIGFPSQVYRRRDFADPPPACSFSSAECVHIIMVPGFYSPCCCWLQTHSSGWMHSVCHPNPATVAVVDCMEKMTRAHCEFLRSERAHIKLNGYSLIRTDPYEGGDAVGPHTNPTNIHIDNAFLSRHDAATPREVYSRSIVYLNSVTEGGAPIVVWPRAHKAAAEVVQRLVSEEGEEAYHGVRWRDEVIAAMTQGLPTADPDAGYDTREVIWPGVGPATEVLMSEGDMIMFEPMSMHSASRCVNGISRYCWVTSFHDDRVRALPHKLCLLQ